MAEETSTMTVVVSLPVPIIIPRTRRPNRKAGIRRNPKPKSRATAPGVNSGSASYTSSLIADNHSLFDILTQLIVLR